MSGEPVSRPAVRVLSAPRGPASFSSRRDFLRRLGGAALSLPLGGLLSACGEQPSGPVLDPAFGEIGGRITGAGGAPLSGRVEGGRMRVVLLYRTGLQTGRTAEVDDAGRFAFPRVEPGSYQLRFWAGRYARVIDSRVENPLRITVEAGRSTEVAFPVELGVFDTSMIEIYAGDDFFQEQPFGELNATTTVRLGQIICWYNVGQHTHNVAVADLVRSPTMPAAASFVWKPERAGDFSYQCDYHPLTMRALLRVVP